MALQDSLKSAAEKFIIEFPEFEDLDLDDLYKEMKKKVILATNVNMIKKPKAEKLKNTNTVEK